MVSGETLTKFLSTKGYYVPERWDVYWANRQVGVHTSGKAYGQAQVAPAMLKHALTHALYGHEVPTMQLERCSVCPA